MSDLKRRLAKMSPSKRREALESLPTYLAEASEGERLHSLLTNFDFIDAKISALAPQLLIADYDLALKSELLASDGGLQRKAGCLKLIQDALRLSAHILAQDKTQLAGQLLGRLLSFEVPEIQGILEQAKQWKAAAWLRTITPTLTPPGEQLLRTLRGHTERVTAVAVTSDGKQVISGSADNTLKVWNLETGEELFTLRGHTLPITSVAVTPDGKLAISGSWGKTLKVWDLEARKELFTLIGHTCMVTAIAVTPDGKRVISGSLDKTLKVWDLEARKEVSTLTLKVHNRMGLLKLIRTILNPQVPFLFKFVWLFFTFLRVGWVNALVVTPDGKQVILALGGFFCLFSDSNLKVLNLEKAEEVFTLKGHTGWVTTLAGIPNSKWVISDSWDKTLKVWNLGTGEELYSLDLKGHSTLVKAVAVAPDGNRMISGSWDKTLKIWNLKLEKELFHRASHAAGVNTVAVIPDGKRVISGSGDNSLKIWNWETGEEILTLKVNCFPTRITALAVTFDGQQVIAGLSDKTIRVWNWQTGEEVLTIKGLASNVKALAITPDSQQVIAGLSDKTIKAWNWQTGEEILTLKGHAARVDSLAITSDGQQVISGSWDNTIKVWDISKRKELFTLTGHTKRVNAVAVTSDGKWSISASQDKTIKVWDLEKRKEHLTLTGHTERVTAVAVTSDSKRVISSSWDNTLKVWDLSSGEMIASFSSEGALLCCAVAPDRVTFVAGEISGQVYFLRLEGV
jgi:WD40 repeat protein